MVYGYARTARENDGANSIVNQTDALKKGRSRCYLLGDMFGNTDGTTGADINA